MPDWSILGLLRFLGGGVCHQFTERSFLIGAAAPPLCARCTGTYLGVMLAISAILLLHRTRASLVASWQVLGALGAFFLFWGVDSVNSFTTSFPKLRPLYEPHNLLRLSTGLLHGLALVLAVWPVVALAFWQHPKRERVINLRELAALVLVGAMLIGLLSQPLPIVRLVAAALSMIGLLAMFTLLNALLLAVALHREGSAQENDQVLRLVALALLPALVELALLGAARRALFGF